MKVTKKLPIFHKWKLDGKLERQTIDDKNYGTDVDKTSQVLHTIKCVRQTMHFI